MDDLQANSKDIQWKIDKLCAQHADMFELGYSPHFTLSEVYPPKMITCHLHSLQNNAKSSSCQKNKKNKIKNKIYRASQKKMGFAIIAISPKPFNLGQ